MRVHLARAKFLVSLFFLSRGKTSRPAVFASSAGSLPLSVRRLCEREHMKTCSAFRADGAKAAPPAGGWSEPGGSVVAGALFCGSTAAELSLYVFMCLLSFLVYV